MAGASQKAYSNREDDGFKVVEEEEKNTSFSIFPIPSPPIFHSPQFLSLSSSKMAALRDRDCDMSF